MKSSFCFCGVLNLFSAGLLGRVGISDRIVEQMSNVRYQTEKLVRSMRTTRFQEIPLETHEARIRNALRWTQTTARARARDIPKGTNRPRLHEAFLWSIHGFSFFLLSKKWSEMSCFLWVYHLVSKRVIYALENPSESPIFYTARSTTQFEVKIDTTYSFTFNNFPSIVFTVGSNS